MRKLHFALIGLGRIGIRHADHIRRLGMLKAVCDIQKEKADNIAHKYSCKSYYDIDELLKSENGIDIVSICTPNWLHAEHAVKALNYKKHVIVEKPMALTLRDCEKIINVADRSNKRLFIVKQNRFNPPLIELKKIIEQNRLGKIFNVQLNCFWNRNKEYYLSSDWKGKLDLDGGTLFTQFSHFIDLLFWLIGDIMEVNSYGDNFTHKGIIEFEDTGVVILKFYNGCIGTINYTVSSYYKNFEGSITIFGENGTLKVGGEYLNKIDYYNIENYKLPKIPSSGLANDYGTYKGSMSNHDKVYENVIDVLTNGATITTNFMDGLKTVQIIEKIYKAQKQNV